ncbi:hypothetical protein [Porphyrobacter sp. GA68]|uniref:hypothetical protein n=1 Tax=Porphyrobacter sp. GA68 TaxID=2883480 RepID=UPI001D184CA8|nr:hypothetical protein [Porphyrobacter sp. GA68]
MNEYAIVSLVALGGFLILALSALRARQMDFKRGAILAGAWIVIFAVVAILTSTLMAA